MDHLEAIEHMEIAAAEPDGLERLAAGDTPEGAALAGHMAGCAACAVEFESLRRLAVAAHQTLADEPAPDLRDRTLAYVAALGRDRGMPLESAGPAGQRLTEAGRLPAPIEAPRPGVARRSPRWRPGWTALAAAVVIAAVAGGVIVGWAQQRSFERDTASLYSLAQVNEEALRIGAAPDAVTVALADPAGGAALGSLVFSGADGEIAVMASGLPVPDAGWEYRCWIETGGVRDVIGRMTLGEGLAYWAGPSEGLDGATAGSVFGVSLVASDAAGGGEPVLLGQVESGSS